MPVLIAFLVGVFVITAHREHLGGTLRFRVLFVGSMVVAASLYSLRVVL